MGTLTPLNHTRPANQIWACCFFVSSYYFCVQFASVLWTVHGGFIGVLRLLHRYLTRRPEMFQIHNSVVHFSSLLDLIICFYEEKPTFPKECGDKSIGRWLLSPSCSLGQCCLYGEPKSSITSSLYSSKQSRLKILFTQLLINCNSLWLNMNVLQILLCCGMLFEITHTHNLLILYIRSIPAPGYYYRMVAFFFSL